MDLQSANSHVSWGVAPWLDACRSLDRAAKVRWAMFGVALVCQAITLAQTWPLWQLREQPPNLSLLPWAHVSFGGWMVASLVAAAVWPRAGVLVHGGVLIVACLFDQLRVQPQLFMLWVLMLGCVFSWGAWLARWMLASMWLWAGLHKWFSRAWFGPVSWTLLERAGIDPQHALLPFAVTVAAGEVALGLLAIFAPRKAAVGCLLVHLGILVFLSPLLADYNQAVWPWNFATAIVGAWLFWSVDHRMPRTAAQWLVVVVLFVAPAGYYWGWVEAHLAHVLYSENMPKGRIISERGVEKIMGWGALRVPFPDAHRMFLLYFQAVGQPGEKLHIDDPRSRVADRLFMMNGEGRIVEIDRAEFLRGGEERVVGIEPDDENAVFALMRLDARSKRNRHGMIEVVVLDNPAIADGDLIHLAALPSLRRLRIDGAGVTDASIEHLKRLKNLDSLQLEETQFTDQGVRTLQQELPGTRIIR